MPLIQARLEYAQLAFPLPAKPLRLGERHLGKPHHVAGSRLRKLREINRNHVGNFRIPAERLAVRREHDGLPVWAALNTSLLSRFEPPPGVHRVVVFADRDVAGLEAALELTARLDGRTTVETRIPKAPANDWADVLEARA